MRAEDRTRGQGRQLVAAVRFVERPVRDAESAKSLDALVKLTFVGNAADDQMGMREVLWNEGASGFNSRVASLDDLLREGEIMPHEDVEVRRFGNLLELHECLQ